MKWFVGLCALALLVGMCCGIASAQCVNGQCYQQSFVPVGPVVGPVFIAQPVPMMATNGHQQPTVSAAAVDDTSGGPAGVQMTLRPIPDPLFSRRVHCVGHFPPPVYCGPPPSCRSRRTVGVGLSLSWHSRRCW